MPIWSLAFLSLAGGFVPLAYIGTCMWLFRRRVHWLAYVAYFVLFGIVVAALAGANPCWCQERQPTNSPALGVNSLSPLEAQVVGSWRFSVPEEETPGMTNAFVTLHISADRSWSLTPGHPDSTHVESDTQSGRWFVHERVLVLRIDETKIRLIEKMATVYDIKSVTKTTLTVTNSPFGDMTWTRVR